MNAKEQIKAAVTRSFREQSIEPALIAVITLNHELTGKSWYEGGDLDGVRRDLHALILDNEMSALIYLSDGGYSRLYIEVQDITADGTVIVGVGLASESRDQVKVRWRELNQDVGEGPCST